MINKRIFGERSGRESESIKRSGGESDLNSRR